MFYLDLIDSCFARFVATYLCRILFPKLNAISVCLPYIVLPKYGVVIMVNGCFWHGHKGCRYATKPKTNVEFWEAKIARNRHRDEVTEAHLHALGWHVITIWECELRGAASATSRLDALAEEIHKAGVTYLVTKLDTVTRTEVKVPINEIVSSHMARRTFIANIYNKVPDPNVVGSMTGHVEGSRAFARYRTIEEDVKKSLVDILG